MIRPECNQEFLFVSTKGECPEKTTNLVYIYGLEG